MSEVDLSPLEPAFEALELINELPCAECGSTGDTLLCITCDKLVCDECGIGTRWCKEHAEQAREYGDDK